MSASREKRNRQNRAEELNQKRQAAAQKAAQEKRKSTLYTVIGVVCAVLVAALLIWDSGYFQGRATALKVNGESYTAAEVSYFYEDMRMQYYYSAMMGGGFNYDPQLPASEQIYDATTGKTWHEFFMDESIDALTEISTLVAAAEEQGVKLSAEGKQQVKENMKSLESTATSSGFSSVASYLKAAYGDGMTKGVYKSLMNDIVLASEMAANYTESLEHSTEEIEAYYTEHADELDLFTYSFVKFSGTPATTTDESGNKVEPTEKEKADAKAQAYTKAERFENSLKRGGDFSELAAAYADDASVTVNEHVTATGTTVMYALDTWMKEDGRKAGDVGLVKLSEDDADTYVVMFLGRERDMELPGNVRHILVAAEQDEGATAPTEAQYDAAKAKAEELLANWQAGEATEESFAKLAEKESADPGSASNGGLYEGVSSSTGFIEDFANWVVDPVRQVGDTDLVKNTMSSTKGWHIMYYCGNDGVPMWQVNVEAALGNEKTTEWLENLVKDVEVELVEKELAKIAG